MTPGAKIKMKNKLCQALGVKRLLYVGCIAIGSYVSSSFAVLQQNEELAEFNAALLFLKYHCDVNLTEEQTQKITFSYIYDRRIATDKIDLVAQQELNIDRYRDLTNMAIDDDKKCTGLKKTFSPVLEMK